MFQMREFPLPPGRRRSEETGKDCRWTTRCLKRPPRSRSLIKSPAESSRGCHDEVDVVPRPDPPAGQQLFEATVVKTNDWSNWSQITVYVPGEGPPPGEPPRDLVRL
jgi:hypothetical protein